MSMKIILGAGATIENILGRVTLEGNKRTPHQKPGDEVGPTVFGASQRGDQSSGGLELLRHRQRRIPHGQGLAAVYCVFGAAIG